MGTMMQVELLGQCPPIEKMDATLSTLKACQCVPSWWYHSHLISARTQPHAEQRPRVCCWCRRIAWQRLVASGHQCTQVMAGIRILCTLHSTGPPVDALNGTHS